MEASVRTPGAAAAAGFDEVFAQILGSNVPNISSIGYNHDFVAPGFSHPTSNTNTNSNSTCSESEEEEEEEEEDHEEEQEEDLQPQQPAATKASISTTHQQAKDAVSSSTKRKLDTADPPSQSSPKKRGRKKKEVKPLESMTPAERKQVEEEKERKRVHRRKMNRIAAQNSRQKQKRNILELSKQVEALQQKNKELEEKNRRLEQMVQQLLASKTNNTVAPQPTCSPEAGRLNSTKQNKSRKNSSSSSTSFSSSSSSASAHLRAVVSPLSSHSSPTSSPPSPSPSATSSSSPSFTSSPCPPSSVPSSPANKQQLTSEQPPRVVDEQKLWCGGKNESSGKLNHTATFSGIDSAAVAPSQQSKIPGMCRVPAPLSLSSTTSPVTAHQLQSLLVTWALFTLSVLSGVQAQVSEQWNHFSVPLQSSSNNNNNLFAPPLPLLLSTLPIQMTSLLLQDKLSLALIGEASPSSSTTTSLRKNNNNSKNKNKNSRRQRPLSTRLSCSLAQQRLLQQQQQQPEDWVSQTRNGYWSEDRAVNGHTISAAAA